MIKVEQLFKSYDGKVVINDLNLQIKDGEIFGFVGPNGAGKTTTMKIIAGLLRADSGKIFIDDVEILNNMNALKKSIGYMPDFFGIYDNLKVIEYLEFYATTYGLSDKEARMRGYTLLDRVNLLEQSEEYVDSLSRGMKQRLCIARSMIHNPKVFLLDEPAAGLDPRTRIELKNILKDLKEEGKIIIISSHILTELSETCTSIGILDRGHILLQGSMDEILSQIDISNPLIIQVLGDPQKAIDVLKKDRLIKTIAVEGQLIMTKFIGSAVQESCLLTELIKNGIPVVSYRREQSNLESLFLKLTDASKENVYEN